MSQTRRTFFKCGSMAAAGVTFGKMIAGAAPLQAGVDGPLPNFHAPNVSGRFKPTVESLMQYEYPRWFRDAKLGFWAHWGPQAVPRHGDWYARRMYMEGSDDYKDHLARYGHPSVHGYKDIIPLWKAERWDPESLMSLYKKAGAKYFVSMGSHHDNFFLWDSRLHRWNSVNYGPRKDVVRIWQKAARKEGLRFGVSEHLGASFTWFQTSHGADKAGPYKGLPYDGAHPIYQDLYHGPEAPDDKEWYSNNKEWHREWLFYILELIDNYQPDLLYTDGPFPFDEYGRTMLSHFYNTDIDKNKGHLEAIYTCKENTKGYWVEDLERGVMDVIDSSPWQTDTSLGDWFYRRGQKRKSSKEVIQMLTDIVSKNGNLLINIVLTPEGDLDADILQTVKDIGHWTAINGEGIYGSRPWKVFGERPPKTSDIKSGSFNESKITYGPEDIRFTTQRNILYAFCLDRPQKDIRIASLGHRSTLNTAAIGSIRLLGDDRHTQWKQHSDCLIIEKPIRIPFDTIPVLGFKIEFKA